jgi:hypothetical protein
MVLMGRLKLSYQDFFIHSMEEIGLILEGHEIDKRDDWERERMSAMIALMPNLKKGAKLDAKKVWPFPWDKEQVKKEIDTMSILEKQRMAKEKFDKIRAKRNGESVS